MAVAIIKFILMMTVKSIRSTSERGSINNVYRMSDYSEGLPSGQALELYAISTSNLEMV